MTSREVEDIKAQRRTCEEVVTALRQTDRWLVTDLNRK
jgi:hypothetical protein